MKDKNLPSFSLPDFLDLDFREDYLVDPLLPANGILLLHGKGGHGKTQWILTLANAVGSGGPLFGRWPVRKGNTLYFQFDMPESLFQERLQRAAREIHHPASITVVPYHKPINITSKAYYNQVADLIELHEPSLIVYDTLRKIHPYDENDNAVPSSIYSHLLELSRGATTAVLHHDRKNPPSDKGSPSDEDARESFRGARAWVDDSDLGVRLRKKRKKGDEYFIMDYSKLRCEDPGIMHLAMRNSLLFESQSSKTAEDWAVKLKQEQPDLDKKAWADKIIEKGFSRRMAYYAIEEVSGE